VVARTWKAHALLRRHQDPELLESHLMLRQRQNLVLWK
jgi:hypothetical protein